MLYFIFTPLLMEYVICDLSKVVLYISCPVSVFLESWSVAGLVLLKWAGQAWFRAVFEVGGKKCSLLEELSVLNDRVIRFYSLYVILAYYLSFQQLQLRMEKNHIFSVGESLQPTCLSTLEITIAFSSC